VVQQPLFSDVTLFTRQADGSFTALPGRLPLTLRQHAFDYRLPSFELNLDDLQPHTYYLRVVSQTALSASLVISQPSAFVQHHALIRFLWGAAYGVYLLMVVFYGLYWMWTRERLHWLYTLYLGTNMMASFFSAGWPRQMLPPMSEQMYLFWLGFWICLAAPVGTLFTLEILQVRGGRLGVMGRWLERFSLGLFPLGLGLILSGQYGWAMSVVQPYMVCLIALSFGLAIWRACHRDRLARFFIVAFGPFYIGVTWRFLQNIGWIEHSFWGNHAYQIGAFIHMLVMSVGVFTLYARLRREKQQVEYRLHSESQMRQQQADFLGMVSHEFRTPLSIIASTSENLLADRDLSPAARLRVDKIIRANKRLSALMDEYLSYERLVTDASGNEYQAVDLVQVARRVRSDVGDAEGPAIQLQASEPVRVMGDAELLRVALQNLVTNARRHSPSGAEVRVVVRQQEGMAEVIVEDQGSGVAEHERSHIFDKFYRGGNALGQPGAGTGLYLVQSIVRQHQGTVEQRNLSPTGCRFIIRLPVC
jgi:signal transduction histidine kinase